MPESLSPDRLVEQMAKLTHEMERRNSFWRVLLLGIVRGIGMVVGATVLAAIMLTILWRVLQGIGLDDLVKKVGIPVPALPSEGVPPEILERYKQFNNP